MLFRRTSITAIQRVKCKAEGVYLIAQDVLPSGKRPLDKRLILIFPHSGALMDWLIFRRNFPHPGLFLFLILRSLTPKDYDVKILDQKIFWSGRDFVANALVGISCNTVNAREGYKIADRFRKAGSTVVMGGIHVSHLPDEALEHCDSVVIGEAESVWPGLVRDYENGELKQIYNGVPLDDWFASSYEYFRSLPPDILRKTEFSLGRGCRYSCDFCSLPFFGKPRFMKVDQAVELISRAGCGSLPSRKRKIAFADNNIFSDPDYARSLFQGLIPLKLTWASSSSIDIAFDQEALSLARQSGCWMLFIGLETIDPRHFPKTSAGGMRSSEDYIKAIKRIQSHGIRVCGHFILGLDDCTHEYCFRLLTFLFKARIDLIDVAFLTPFPGTREYERLRGENRIITYAWHRFNPGRNIVFKPKHMSPPALFFWKVVIESFGLIMSCFSPNFLVRGMGIVNIILIVCAVFLMFYALGSLCHVLFVIFYVLPHHRIFTGGL